MQAYNTWWSLWRIWSYPHVNLGYRNVVINVYMRSYSTRNCSLWWFQSISKYLPSFVWDCKLHFFCNCWWQSPCSSYEHNIHTLCEEHHQVKRFVQGRNYMHYYVHNEGAYWKRGLLEMEAYWRGEFTVKAACWRGVIGERGYWRKGLLYWRKGLLYWWEGYLVHRDN